MLATAFPGLHPFFAGGEPGRLLPGVVNCLSRAGNAKMRVLGIETSCDETGIAVYDSDAGIIADMLHSQLDLHQRFGGVVPELASRDHIRKTLPMIDEVLTACGSKPADMDGIAYTAGPGLVGALLVGASIARGLGLAWQVPAIGIHHMEGHLLAAFLDRKTGRNLQFPLVALLVSGGHTLLVKMSGIGQYQLLGESLDDAAGEAFDKTARSLGLGYPGGPEIARAAESGKRGRFVFPRPMTDRPGLDFSFSGLKTHTLTCITELRQNGPLSSRDIADTALAFEIAVAETLTIKCRRALRETGCRDLVVAGGVGANQRLRARLADMTESMGARLHYPSVKLCTDNGAMIAYAGEQRLAAGCMDPEPETIFARARWPLDELSLV